MEIKGLKFAQNKTFADCLRGMTPELVLVPKRDSARSRSGASTAAGKSNSNSKSKSKGVYISLYVIFYYDFHITIDYPDHVS